MDGLQEWVERLLIPALSALLGGGVVKVLADHWYQRQQAHVARKAEQRQTQLVDIEAEKVVITERETDIHEAQELRTQFEAAMRINDTVIQNLDTEVKRLAAAVTACYDREQIRDKEILLLRARVSELEARA
jgi:hypothetical protein